MLDREFNYERNARRIIQNGVVGLAIWNFKVTSFKWASTKRRIDRSQQLIQVLLTGRLWTLRCRSNGIRQIRHDLSWTLHFRFRFYAKCYGITGGGRTLKMTRTTALPWPMAFVKQTALTFSARGTRWWSPLEAQRDPDRRWRATGEAAGNGDRRACSKPTIRCETGRAKKFKRCVRKK